ncbi:hypothetical protein JL722_8458 [Aureococcus anophagefferens]|nr:hypothetical protein JL722_8458 [Aureococcus anophagefferens]
MADRGKIPKKKDKLAGTTSIKPPGDAMHAAQAKNRKPEQQGAFSSGSSPAKASAAGKRSPTGTKPKDGGGPRTTAADKRKVQETHRPASAKAEKKRAARSGGGALKFTSVSAAETKPKAPKAPKPAKNYPDFDDDDDAPPASPGKPSKREADERAKLLAGGDSDGDDLLGAVKPEKSSADVLAELRGDSDDDADLLGDTKPEKSNADVLAELGGDFGRRRRGEPRSPRKKAARTDGKRKSGGAGAPAKKKPKAPSSSSGSDSEEPLDDFFWKERDGEGRGHEAHGAVAAPSRECPHAAVAPGALASIEYAVPSSALVWVKVGRSFYYDGRKQSGDQRPGYVLPQEELEDLGIPKPVGGEHMRVVRLFDDHAFVPWDGPKAVRASETKDFGSGRSSNYWEKGKVRTLEKDCAPVEFTHVFTLGAEAALRLAFEHDRAQGVTAKIGARRVQEADERPQRRNPRGELEEYGDADRAYDAAALDDPPAALDADIVAACAKSLGDVVDGTLIARIQCAERAGRPQQ